MAGKRTLRFQFRFPEFLLLILLILSGTALAFSSGSFVVSFKRIGFSVFSTAEKGVRAVTKTASDTFGAVRELARLRRDYDDLVRKLENYERMQRSNAEIRRENERLKEQLDFAVSLENRNYPAQIIARDSDNLYAYFTVNKGSRAGIRKNMPVVAYQNGNTGLVGKVIQTGPFTSLVMPVFNIDCSVSVRIQNTRDIGLATGKGGTEDVLLLKYIAKKNLDTLHYGDVVVTSGESSGYMRDVPVGTISKITVIDYDASLDIELTPMLDFSRLETVVIVDLLEVNESKRGAP